MHLHEALQLEDWKEFLEAMDVEILGHEQGQHWVVVRHTAVPKGTPAKVLDTVWALCRKRRFDI